MCHLLLPPGPPLLLRAAPAAVSQLWRHLRLDGPKRGWRSHGDAASFPRSSPSDLRPAVARAAVATSVTYDQVITFRPARGTLLLPPGAVPDPRGRRVSD